MKKVFIVRLTETERAELDALARKGKAAALTIAHARILLKADQGKDGEARTDASRGSPQRRCQDCLQCSPTMGGRRTGGRTPPEETGLPVSFT
jgi:hypothetical protein